MIQTDIRASKEALEARLKANAEELPALEAKLLDIQARCGHLNLITTPDYHGAYYASMKCPDCGYHSFV